MGNLRQNELFGVTFLVYVNVWSPFNGGTENVNSKK